MKHVCYFLNWQWQIYVANFVKKLFACLIYGNRGFKDVTHVSKKVWRIFPLCSLNELKKNNDAEECIFLLSRRFWFKKDAYYCFYTFQKCIMFSTKLYFIFVSERSGSSVIMWALKKKLVILFCVVLFFSFSVISCVLQIFEAFHTVLLLNKKYHKLFAFFSFSLQRYDK